MKSESERSSASSGVLGSRDASSKGKVAVGAPAMWPHQERWAFRAAGQCADAAVACEEGRRRTLAWKLDQAAALSDDRTEGGGGAAWLRVIDISITSTAPASFVREKQHVQNAYTMWTWAWG